MSLLHFQIRGGKCNTMLFPFFQKKKERKKKKRYEPGVPKAEFCFQGKKCPTAQQQHVLKPNLKQEKACLMHLTRWKSKFTLFKWQQGHWSADALSCIKQIGCSILILSFTYFLKRKAGLLLELLCAHVSGMANTSVRSWFNVSLQV